MNFSTIYFGIGLIELLLCSLQVKVLMLKEEREYNFRYKYVGTDLERYLSFVKMLLIFSVPIFRTIVTFAILFSETAHETILDSLDAGCELIYLDENGAE